MPPLRPVRVHSCSGDERIPAPASDREAPARGRDVPTPRPGPRTHRDRRARPRRPCERAAARPEDPCRRRMRPLVGSGASVCAGRTIGSQPRSRRWERLCVGGRESRRDEVRDRAVRAAVAPGAPSAVGLGSAHADLRPARARDHAAGRLIASRVDGFRRAGRCGAGTASRRAHVRGLGDDRRGGARSRSDLAGPDPWRRPIPRTGDIPIVWVWSDGGLRQ